LKGERIIIDINKTTLIKALNNMFNTGFAVTDALFTSESLRGGTVGEVCRISGEAVVNYGEATRPFTLVLKEQKKWERKGDSNSWRREYDIYKKIDDLNSVLPGNIRLPVCYFAHEFIREETPVWQIYMEDAGGISGNKLSLEMLEYVMAELGRFQGYVCKNKPAALQAIDCFTDYETYFKSEVLTFIYKEVADNIEPADCDTIPKHLRDILTDNILNNIDNTISAIKRLPKTLCHRDMWNANIFLSADNIITLIDWDCAGWGFVGEDVIQLISELFIDRIFDIDFKEYSDRLLAAYKLGASDYINTDFLPDEIFRAGVLLHCGHKIFWGYKYSGTAKKKKDWINLLQKIYEMWFM
jgi:hypothetical protein